MAEPSDDAPSVCWARDAEPASERRFGARVPVDMWVEESTARELYFQRSANIGLGGLCLRQAIPRERGSELNLRFVLPGEASPLLARGKVVNIGRGGRQLGMGLRFVNLTEEVRCRIADFVARCRPSHAGVPSHAGASAYAADCQPMGSPSAWEADHGEFGRDAV